MKSQLQLCQTKNLLGRIIIAKEGINGTISGTVAATKAYIKATEKDLGKIEWKKSPGPKDAFPKISIKVRDEIVTLGIKNKGKDVDLKNKADYIEPKDLLNLYEQKQEFYIIDARNTYEAQVGKFKDAIIPPIKNFRDFPEFTKKIKHLKNKPVITYCTGGIRCEKASAFLKEQGFKNVRQLHGGIHRYGELAGGKNFEGEMFVFDKRLTTPVNTVNPTHIAKCKHCKQETSKYSDCIYKHCDQLFICCEPCKDKYFSACSKKCLKLVQKTGLTSTKQHGTQYLGCSL